VLLLATILGLWVSFPQPDEGKTQASTPVGLPAVRVAVLYENITDGVYLDRSIDETLQILKETRADLVFRAFWKWMPVVDSPDEIPPELIQFARELAELRGEPPPTPQQIAANLRRTGHYYEELRRWIAAIKRELPDVLFVGAIPAQTLARVEWDPITRRVYNSEQTWAMALDPQKWSIRYRGRPVTKEEFQAWFYGIHPYGGSIEEYDRRTVPAYFPDLTNPQFQALLLNWAKKQIDCGANAIWIDMLYRQATLLAQMTGDLQHSAVQESLVAAAHIVEEIHQYGMARGRRVSVGSWAGPFVLAELEGQEFPYNPPQMDFVTLSPTIEEVLQKRLDVERWREALALIFEKYGKIPLIAFIDWSFDESPLVAFSQQLTPEEQRQALRAFDRAFQELGIIFAYPVHGGYLGRGEVTTRLAFGHYRVYDALAPEFNTYETIRELAQARATDEVPGPYGETYVALQATLEEFDRYLAEIWDGEPYDVAFGANLLPANLHAGEAMLDPAYYEQTLRYLDALKALGVRLIHLDIGYPLLSEEFPRSSEYLALYRRLAEEIRARRLKLHVEFEFALPEWIPVSYEGFTKGRVRDVLLEYAERICRELRPDFYTIVDEPHTQNERLGLEISVPEWTAFVSHVKSRLSCPDPEMQIGAGGGTWEEPYVRSFARNTEVDFINLHLYGLHRGDLYKLVELAGFARAQGKGVGIGETWAHYGGQDWLRDKWRYSDVFSFWAPLDAQFMRILVGLAHWQRLAFLDPFFTGYFFAYLDYDEVQRHPEEYLPPNRMLGLALDRAMEAAAAGQLTEASRAYREAVATVGTGTTRSSADCEGNPGESPCLPANLPPEYEQVYREMDTWLDRKLGEWRPSTFKPMHFMGFHLPLSGGLRDFTDLDDDLRFLQMLTELGVDVFALGIVGVPEDIPPALLERYDRVIAAARARGLKLKLWLRSFMYGPRERPPKVLSATEFIIRRWHPEYFTIVHEPKGRERLSQAFVRSWVEAACERAKQIDPDVKASATALNSERGIDYVDVFVEIPCLDIVGFDIYNLWGLCEECPGGDAIEEKIKLIHSRGKGAWVEEFWLTTQWNRRTPDPTDMFPGFNDPCRAWWDARFLRVMAYYAQRHDLLGIEPWFTMYFVLYPGYDDLWQFEGGRQMPTEQYLADFREALAEGKRTLSFHEFEELIAKIRSRRGSHKRLRARRSPVSQSS